MSDAAIRAHLRFVAEALAACGADGREVGLRAFPDRLAGGLAESPELDRTVGRCVRFNAWRKAVTRQVRLRLCTPGRGRMIGNRPFRHRSGT